MSAETIRWKQRFQNLKKAWAFLLACSADAHRDEKSDVAIIKAFEMAFELAWKTLQDLMTYQGVQTLGGRDAIKASFSRGLLADGQGWLDMLDQRNALVHVYDAAAAKAAVERIVTTYQPLLKAVVEKLDQVG